MSGKNNSKLKEKIDNTVKNPWFWVSIFTIICIIILTTLILFSKNKNDLKTLNIFRLLYD